MGKTIFTFRTADTFGFASIYDMVVRARPELSGCAYHGAYLDGCLDECSILVEHPSLPEVAPGAEIPREPLRRPQVDMKIVLPAGRALSKDYPPPYRVLSVTEADAPAETWRNRPPML